MDCWEYIGDLKATDINDLEEKIIQDLEITLIPEKKMGGQTEVHYTVELYYVGIQN